MVALLLPLRRGTDAWAELADARDSKRPRRSIFISDESDSDPEEEHLACPMLAAVAAGSPGSLRPDSRHALNVVPATPFAARALSSGACLLSPSFPRRASSPGGQVDAASTAPSCSDIVALCEEPNAAYRSYMEDRCAHMVQDGVAYFGCYDGHGGADASVFLQRNLLPAIQSRLKPGCDVHDALLDAFVSTNAAFKETGSIQGSTATTVILKDRRLIAANVGDSPAFVIKRNGEVFCLINEHKIEGEEAARIAKHVPHVPIYKTATGPAYMGTPDGTRWLNMSRAFGDFVYPAISCEPHVCTLDVSDGRYLVMGSDGLTEKWPMAEVAQYVTQLAAHGTGLQDITRCLVERSKARGSTDNISCMVVDLLAWQEATETAEAAALPSPTSVGTSTGASSGEGEDKASEGLAGVGPSEQEAAAGRAWAPRQSEHQPCGEQLLCTEGRGADGAPVPTSGSLEQRRRWFVATATVTEQAAPVISPRSVTTGIIPFSVRRGAF